MPFNPIYDWGQLSYKPPRTFIDFLQEAEKHRLEQRRGNVESELLEAKAPYASDTARYGLMEQKAKGEHAEESELAKIQETLAHALYLKSHPHGAGGRGFAPPNIIKLINAYKERVAQYGENDPEARILAAAIEKSKQPAWQGQRGQFGEDLLTTLNEIDTEALTDYSGILGGLLKLFDEGVDLATGNAPERLVKHKTAVGKSHLAEKQLAQASKGSTSKNAQESREGILNPTSLSSSPQTAKQQTEANYEILRREYGRGSQNTPQSQSGVNPEKVKALVAMSDAEWDRLERAAEEAARKKGKK
jgi:hypothetical protein